MTCQALSGKETWASIIVTTTLLTTDAAALWLCRAKGFEPLSLSPLGERNLRDAIATELTSPAECIQFAT